MVKYTENELFSITDFTKKISTLLKDVKNNSLEKIGVLKNNRLEAVVLSTEEYARLKQIEEESINQKWEYWKDEELDNFGKISIGLSKNNYADDEDYSKW
jgi:PHD/YefM family antitoxin component YafN of YafNO toxin-antitoxin module